MKEKHKEIEAKAHITPFEKDSLIQKFNKMYGTSKSEIKKDAYFEDEDGTHSRIREEGGEYIYTKKRQSMKGSIEVNDEDEKILSESQKDVYIQTHKILLFKSKQGYIWTTAIQNGTESYQMNIEIVKVEGQYKDKAHRDLGWFLEVELLIPNADTITIEWGTKTINAFFKDHALDLKIEKRKYMEMLK